MEYFMACACTDAGNRGIELDAATRRFSRNRFVHLRLFVVRETF